MRLHTDTGPRPSFRVALIRPAAAVPTFEVVVLEGKNLVHYFFDPLNSAAGWQRASLVTPNATGPDSIMESNFGVSENLNVPGYLEVVVQEGRNLVITLPPR
jgi:hypothetical protein